MGDNENKENMNQQEPANNPEPQKLDEGGQTPTVEELMEELAKERAQRERDKKALDKTLKEMGMVKKQNDELQKTIRASRTKEEQEAIEKQEADEAIKAEIDELKTYRAKSEAQKRYMTQGMPADMAEKAADAEISGDMDELVAIQKKFLEETLKNKEAEWLKSRPDIEAGAGSDEEVDPFLKAFNSTPARFAN